MNYIGLVTSSAALLAVVGCTSTSTTGASGGSCTPGNASLAGHYYLNGIMEVGSEILLRPDGSFEFMLAYGANDQYGRGCWVKEGPKLLLIPAGRGRPSGRHTPDDRGFGGLVLTVEGGDLVWELGRHRGYYRR